MSRPLGADAGDILSSSSFLICTICFASILLNLRIPILGVLFKSALKLLKDINYPYLPFIILFKQPKESLCHLI
ncbi:hypothetical protein CISIN_1g042268mg [Citrus sinensis]|uniref:Uncharacterized protein n=1 Tax=Citrus sinensis TaxID=2711 RepID=A0A067ETG6_CITSI|nr:hypothetical protein CISIN_1g042268mg [Citrus sinensis]